MSRLDKPKAAPYLAQRRGLPVLPNFEATVLALADALVRRRAECGDGDVETVYQFLMGVHRRMPAYLRLPFVALGLTFDSWALLTSGKPFHKLDRERRERQIEAWRQSRFEVRRRYIEFYSALATFGLYSELYAEDYRNPAGAASHA